MNREDRLSSFSLSVGLLSTAAACSAALLPRAIARASAGPGSHALIGAAGTLGKSAPLSSESKRIRVSLALTTVTSAIGSYTNLNVTRSFRSSAADGSRSHHSTVIACSPAAEPAAA
jgi:hypothetical protein